MGGWVGKTYGKNGDGCALDGFAEAGDGGQDLLGEVPFHVYLELPFGTLDVVWVEGSFSLLGVGGGGWMDKWVGGWVG